ncbi:hypothetical protein V8D89_002879 [Ganoderma adspersum]
MQFTFDALVKLTVFAVVANMAAAVALPEPVGLEARQGGLSCLANLCTPGATSGCCPGASCTGLNLLGLPLPGICTPSICNVICSKTSDCCTNVAGTTFTCELILGQSVGVCIPQIL